MSADQETQDYLDLVRAAHQAGREEAERERSVQAYEAGRLDAEEAMANRWDRITAPVTSGSPDQRELEERRWGPSGREHFGDPRDGDYQGGPVKWAEPDRPQPSGRVPSPRQDVERAAAAATTAAHHHKEAELGDKEAAG